MKVLIIGSQGFIGSHCYDHFSKDHAVWTADVVKHIDQVNFEQLSEDRTDFRGLMSKEKFDVCINASGNGNVSRSIQDPLYDYKLNVVHPLKMLDAIREFCPGCKFINFSSAAIYGNPEVLPISESGGVKPISPYGWHKHYAEELCRQYYTLYNISTISLRVFSVFGEGLRKQLFWDAHQKIQRSREVEFFGTGDETRDFIYIADLMRVLDVVIAKALFDGRALNVASGVATTIRDAVSHFCAAIDSSIHISFNNVVKAGDPLFWCADISQLRALGFEPAYSFERAIKKVAQWIIAEKK